MPAVMFQGTGSDVGEIGRAQALQALACRVLIKPQSDTGAQIVVRGAVKAT